jgi:hypothetical protein
MLFRILSLFFCIINLIDLSISEKQKAIKIKCADLHVGQYRCQHPKIDDLTQEPQGCERQYILSNEGEKYDDSAPVSCYTAPKIICEGGIYNETLDGHVFNKRIPCRWTNGKYYRTTLALSLFLGIDFLS